MTGIQGFPHDLPKYVGRWLPKFSNHNEISVEDHLISFYNALGLHDAQYEHEDVIMRLFSSSLIGDARSWYNNLPNKGIKTWEVLQSTFLKRWEVKKDGKLTLVPISPYQKKGRRTYQ
jgi:hypothetical protein